MKHNSIWARLSRSKVNIVLLLLLFAFFIDIFYVRHVKEKTIQEYELFSKVQSMKISYQKIDRIFEKRSHYQSFDEIVKDSKKFQDDLLALDVQTDITEDKDRIHDLSYQLKRDFEEAQNYVERYKSWNALMTNSMRLSYDAHAYIKLLLEHFSSGKDKVDSLRLLDEITYQIALIEYDGLDEIEHLREKMKTFKALTASYPKVLEPIKKLYKHVDMILKAYELMDTLRSEHKKLHIPQTLDTIQALLFNDLKFHDQQSELRVYVLNFIVAVFLLFLFLIHEKELKLNKKVYTLNNKLEEKVDSLNVLNNDFRDLIDKFDKNVIASKTDTKGIITYASHAFCSASGYSKEELIGQPHNIVRHEDTPKELFKDMWKTLKEGKEWQGEFKNKAKDGTPYWVEMIASPEFSIDGSIVGYSAIRHKITDKKDLELLSNSLEDQVLSRTKELETMMQEVERLSITDELTQLYNRRYYTQMFDKELRRSKRDKQVFNYLLVDLDNFKPYNDTYGHQLGDSALQAVAAALVSLLNRPSDYVFRMGGEEFVVLFSSETKEQAQEFVQKIRESILSLHIEHSGNAPYGFLTLSGGLISCPPDKGVVSENEIYKKADRLLYQAKDEGRNRIKSA